MFSPHRRSKGNSNGIAGKELILKGIVQGVGFRPLVYRLAIQEKLRGFVTNTAGSVRIVLEGPPEGIESFKEKLVNCLPRGAAITDFIEREIGPQGFDGFSIRKSEEHDPPFFTIPADMATCRACESELFNPSDRRYRYPFINCTDCGPRFTIVREAPYDRARTSMSVFAMCPECLKEYEDPLTRRYHAEPNACPRCGPKLSLLDANGEEVNCTNPLEETCRLLLEGKIVAIKGLGGFHLAVDATSDTAVKELRRRKRRDEKPFAVMVADLDMASKLCPVSETSKNILLSKESPILLIEAGGSSPLAPSVAPGLSRIGIFLPYTPLHRLIMDGVKRPLVMTSGNLSDEPIATGNREVTRRLKGIADAYLVHDREIVQRSDDSVVSELFGSPYPIRRARGYVPVPVILKEEIPEVIGLGGELKCTITVTKGRFAYVSQHIGDMESPLSREFYREVFSFFTGFLKSTPQAVCRDLHPAYFTTQIAEKLAEEAGAGTIIQLQHHRAHIYSLLAESGFSGKGAGVAFDGTGYGDDGAIWGGEFFQIEGPELRRVAAFKYFPLQGGDSTIKEPWKTALSLLKETFGEMHARKLGKKLFPEIPAESVELVLSAIANNVNCVNSSSCGRIFDAASAITGTILRANYEGQAAMTFEALLKKARGPEKPYPWGIIEEGDFTWIDARPLFEKLTKDVLSGESPQQVSLKFHLAVAEIISEVCRLILEKIGGETVLLSGGVFQNLNLTELAVEKIEKKGYKVILHRQVPPNDGGLSLGQAFYAANKLMGRVN